MACDRKPSNYLSNCAIKVLKESKTVGLIPQLFLKTFSLILLSGSSMKVCGNGRQEEQRENRLQFPCITTIKASGHIYVKLETIIKDLCGRLV